MKISWTYSTYDGTTTSKKSPSFHQKPQVRSLEKIQEMRATLLELTMNEVEDVHEVMLGLLFIFFLPFSYPISHPFSL